MQNSAAKRDLNPLDLRNSARSGSSEQEPAPVQRADLRAAHTAAKRETVHIVPMHKGGSESICCCWLCWVMPSIQLNSHSNAGTKTKSTFSTSAKQLQIGDGLLPQVA